MPIKTVLSCQHYEVPPDVCYIRFVPRSDTVKRSTREIGFTARGETMIADFDAEGRVIGIELVGGNQPCQA